MKYQTDRPIYLQVIDDIRQKLIRGELIPGEKLPSVRDLALEYQINPNTASRVYREMEAQGLCFTKRGMGTFLTEENTIINGSRQAMAEECLDAFWQKMTDMGYNLDDMIRLLKEKSESSAGKGNTEV